MSGVWNQAVQSTHGSNLMPRHPRLFIPGATYHVYCRVARGESVFDDECEAVEFADRFASVSGYELDELASRCRSTRHITG